MVSNIKNLLRYKENKDKEALEIERLLENVIIKIDYTQTEIDKLAMYYLKKSIGNLLTPKNIKIKTKKSYSNKEFYYWNGYILYKDEYNNFHEVQTNNLKQLITATEKSIISYIELYENVKLNEINKYLILRELRKTDPIKIQIPIVVLTYTTEEYSIIEKTYILAYKTIIHTNNKKDVTMKIKNKIKEHQNKKKIKRKKYLEDLI